MEYNNIAQKFRPLHNELRKLLKHYNPTDKNLHFYPLESVDSKLYDRLLKLARKGLKLVNLHRDFFLYRAALYADGMFWYDLFLLISAAGIKAKLVNKRKTKVSIGLRATRS